MPDNEDQPLDEPLESGDTVNKTKGPESTDTVDDSGAEEQRGYGNKDEIIRRLKRQRDRDRERLSELEARMNSTQQQPSSHPNTSQPASGIDWTNPEASIQALIDRRLSAGLSYTKSSIQSDMLREKAREYIQSQKGYNEDELKMVFEDHPELERLYTVDPMASVRLAVQVWRMSKGDVDSVTKRMAAGGINPSAPPGRSRGAAEIFDRVRRNGGDVAKDDLDKAWGELERAEKRGVPIKF